MGHFTVFFSPHNRLMVSLVSENFICLQPCLSCFNYLSLLSINSLLLSLCLFLHYAVALTIYTHNHNSLLSKALDAEVFIYSISLYPICEQYVIALKSSHLNFTGRNKTPVTQIKSFTAYLNICMY